MMASGINLPSQWIVQGTSYKSTQLRHFFLSRDVDIPPYDAPTLELPVKMEIIKE